MREASETTRQRIEQHLRSQPMGLKALADAVDVSADDTLDHVRHVARSLESTDAELLVSPPTCRDCGFDEFDDPANRPSRCPECKSESIDEPVFTIR